MQSGNAALSAALASGERSYEHVGRFGGQDLSPQIQSWQLDQAYNTDLPDAMRAFSGSSAAQLQVQLSGSYGVPAPVQYSPWAPRSSGDVVRPGQSVVFSTGLNTNTQLPLFRGSVRSRSADSGTDAVQIVALDGAERLRGPAVLPRPYAGFFGQRPVASATWCVDELLRQAGIFTCPQPRSTAYSGLTSPYTVVYATLHGGFVPVYGIPEDVPVPSQYTWTRAAAPFEIGVVPTAPGMMMSWMPRERATAPFGGLLLEAYVNTLVGAPNGKQVILKAVVDRTGAQYGAVQVTVDFSTGIVTAWSGIDGTTTGTSTTWTFPQLLTEKGNWHLGAVVDFEWSVNGTYDANHNWTSNAPVVVPILRAPDGTILTGGGGELDGTGIQLAGELYKVEVVTDFVTECVQVTAGVSAQFPVANFEQTWNRGARLDDVSLPLYSIPQVSGSQWDVITEIANAALSTAEFDAYGIFRWRNHNRFDAGNPAELTPVRTVTTTQDISSITVSEEIDACRNYCIVPYQDWTQVTATPSLTQTDTSVRTIPPGGSSTQVSVPFLLDAAEFDVGPVLVEDDVKTYNGSVVRFASSTVANSPAIKGQVEVDVERSNGVLTLYMRNYSTNPLYTTTKTGTTSSLTIVTMKPSADPVERQVVALDTTSQGIYGVQSYTASTSDWLQDAGAAAQLSTWLLNAGRYPIPVYSNVEVLYDPRLQLGDVIQLVDYSGAYMATPVWVVGNSVVADTDGTVTQTLTLRGTQYNGAAPAALTPDPAVDPNAWILQQFSQLPLIYPTFADIKSSGRQYQNLLNH
ncbi:hypothetical protein P3T36_003188 [Kitasatospora sp. MAP12-15]|uniref:hypothetical protein n=1 Tax=unclassified Kitasatospora TaxID=2633591 RepID=UPI002476F177|nr:hypothetical protein [Kitasatospora sp. MAP12-44]MDH6111164.1 hypothetical protein [Kitasatospora sp. MAP12-44]